MKHKLNTHLFKLLLLAFVVSIFSCETEDKQLLHDNTDQFALGTIKSLEIFSGLNRVVVKGYVDDPDISEVKIFWDDRAESAVVPVSGETDTISKEIDGLQERIYTFEVQTFDAAGNSSRTISGGAEVFGSGFVSRAENRELTRGFLLESNLDVTYSTTASNTGIIGTEIVYEDTSGVSTDLYLTPDLNSFSVDDFKSGSTLKYRSVFIPSFMTLDTVYTAYEEFTPIPTPILKNASVPFEASETGGRWGILAEPWVTNDAILIHNGFGGWDEWNGNIFNAESGWGAPDIINGKIYQTVEVLLPGTFVLHVNLISNNHEILEDEGAYFVITTGEGLPDFENIETAPEVLAYQSLEGSINDYTIEFTTDEPDQLISVGFLTTQKGNNFANIRSWEILPSN